MTRTRDEADTDALHRRLHPKGRMRDLPGRGRRRMRQNRLGLLPRLPLADLVAPDAALFLAALLV
jgi:hypothetical protein